MTDWIVMFVSCSWVGLTIKPREVTTSEVITNVFITLSLLRSLFAGPRFSPHVQAAYCSNTFHSNCLANHSLSTRIRNYSRQNLLIPKQRWRRMIKHCVKSPIISYFYFQRSSKECDSNNN